MNLLNKYYKSAELKYSVDVLKIVECDIREYTNDPYDSDVDYAGRLDSRTPSFGEWIVPEFTEEVNIIAYIHDRTCDLVKLGITGYTKEFVDSLFHNLLECEGFIFADLYYFMVKHFGGSYE